MERPSKPPLGDFPAIGGRGRIDGDTYMETKEKEFYYGQKSDLPAGRHFLGRP